MRRTNATSTEEPTMATATKKTGMTKKEMAEALALAMNLLNDVRASSDGEWEWSNRQVNEFHALAHMLPEATRDDFLNNGTLFPRDLGC